MNYTNLQSRILANFQNRSDITTVIQNAIADSRREICYGKINMASGNLAQHRWSFCFRSSNTQATTASLDYYSYKTGCIELLSISNAGDTLQKIDFDTWQRNFEGSTATAEPNVWVPLATTYKIAPVPDAVYTLTLHEYGFLTELSDGTDEYALESKYPETIIYRASEKIAQYLGEDNLLKYFSNQAELFILSAIQSDLGIVRRKTMPRFRHWREVSVSSDEYYE